MTTVVVNCSYCGGLTEKLLGKFNAARAAGRSLFCDRVCMAKARRGVEHEKVDPQVRFWSKVFVGADDECWLWTACKNKLGYGRFYFNGRQDQAHRVAWYLTRGDVSREIEIRHRCDNPPCVNPKHLEPGTHAENMHDMAVRGRSNKGRIVPEHQILRGERHPMCGRRVDSESRSNLTWETIRSLRQAVDDGLSRKDAAIQFNLGYWNVCAIVARKSWRENDPS